VIYILILRVYPRESLLEKLYQTGPFKYSRNGNIHQAMRCTGAEDAVREASSFLKNKKCTAPYHFFSVALHNFFVKVFRTAYIKWKI
jgi:hypothetical protein